jgi:hypothetical protein
MKGAGFFDFLKSENNEINFKKEYLINTKDDRRRLAKRFSTLLKLGEKEFKAFQKNMRDVIAHQDIDAFQAKNNELNVKLLKKSKDTLLVQELTPALKDNFKDSDTDILFGTENDNDNAYVGKLKDIDLNSQKIFIYKRKRIESVSSSDKMIPVILYSSESVFSKSYLINTKTNLSILSYRYKPFIKLLMSEQKEFHHQFLNVRRLNIDIQSENKLIDNYVDSVLHHAEMYLGVVKLTESLMKTFKDSDDDILFCTYNDHDIHNIVNVYHAKLSKIELHNGDNVFIFSNKTVLANPSETKPLPAPMKPKPYNAPKTHVADNLQHSKKR